MAISLASLQRKSTPKPPRIMVYGVAGVGKTTLGTMAPSPVFLQTEDSEVDVPTFGLLRSYGEIMEAIASLYTEPHEFKSVVLDSIDWTEPLVWAETCRVNNWQTIETPGYGKGPGAALEQWRSMLDGLNSLRDERGMSIIMIGHAEIRRFDSPESDPYDRYQPKLQRSASALLQEHVDAVLFANYRTSVVKAEAGFNKKVARGVGGGERLLHTNERPAFIAKNRFNLPDSIPLDWTALAGMIPYYAVPEPAASPSTETSNTETKE